MSDERWIVKIGNCYVRFMGLREHKVVSDKIKASPFLTKEDAKEEAKKYFLKHYEVVKTKI